MEISSDMSSRKLRITLLADEWKSSKGGLSTINRELAIQLAKHPNVLATFFVPKCTEDDKKAGSSHNISVVEAKERPGYPPVDWLTFPPRDLHIDVIIGHGVRLGKQAQVIRESHHCIWVQVVHTAPEQLAGYKIYTGAFSKGEEKQLTELTLCEMADLVVPVGPKLFEMCSAYLFSTEQKIFQLTPGIFADLSSLKQSPKGDDPFRVLLFGRGDAEDFELKGYDIAAKAVTILGKSYNLLFVGAYGVDEVAKKLLAQGLSKNQLVVRSFVKKREDLAKLLCASNLAVIPSRSEGFGLTAFEALSAGLPFLVSQNSGFGEALQEIPSGTSCIVDSEDPDKWAKAIEDVRENGREKALEACQELRERYAEMYNWENQCNDLVKMMLSLVNVSSRKMESAVAALSHNRHDQASNEKSENKGEEVHSVATSRCELCQEILGKNPKHLTEAVKGEFQMPLLDKNKELGEKQEKEKSGKSPTLGGPEQDNRSLNELRVRKAMYKQEKQTTKGTDKQNLTFSNKEGGARPKEIPPSSTGRTNFKEKKSRLSRFYMFNCDDTYEMDPVEQLLRAVVRGDLYTFKHYFKLDQMPRMVTKIIPGTQMDMAFLVVLAHESQLLINQDDAEIGYTKIYRALHQATEGNVIIVIGGDDNYKDADEEDRHVISRWARRRMESQFDEEFLDGRKSFIFSWNKKHRAIHEEALRHHFDPGNRGQKFQYQPPERPVSVSHSLPRVQVEQLKNERKQLSRPKQPLHENHAVNGQGREDNRSRSKAESWSNSTKERREASNVYQSGATTLSTTMAQPPMLPPSPERPMTKGAKSANTPTLYSNQGIRPTEMPSPSLKRPKAKDATSANTTPFYSDQSASHKEMSPQSLEIPKAKGATNGNTPPWYSNQYAVPTEMPSPSLKRPKAKDITSVNTTPCNSNQLNQGARPAEKPSPSVRRRKTKELAILGCNAFETSMCDVMKAFQDVAPQLNLSEAPLIENHHSNDSVKEYLMANSLRFCVLVVDADDIRNASEHEPQKLVEFHQLLETAADKVVEKVIILICGSHSLTQPDEAIVDGTMHLFVNKRDKILAVWLKNGKLAVDADVLAHFMTTSPAHTENLQAVSSSRTGYLGQTQECHMGNPTESRMNLEPNRQFDTQQPQGPLAPRVTATSSSEETVMLESKLRYGEISYQYEDLYTEHSGFQVPYNITQSLRDKYDYISEAGLVIVKDHYGKLRYAIDISKEPSIEEGMEFIDYDRVMLITHVRHGEVTFHEDLEFIKNYDWNLPQSIVNSLQREYATKPDLKLYVLSDEEGNLEYELHIQGKLRKLGNFARMVWNKITD